MAWKFGLTTLDGTAIGEVHNAYERRLTIPLNGLPTASFRIRLDNPLASEITDRSGDVRLKVYRDGITLPVFHGELTGAEEVGADGASLACTFAGPLWRLQKRMCLNEAVPPDPNAVSFPSQDRAQILKKLLDRANAVSETGIQGGTYAALYPALAGEWNYKPIAEAFTEMAASGAFFFETATGAVALDNFNGMTVGATLIGRAASAGGTWNVSGGVDTHPWIGYTGTAIVRSADSDASIYAGRWAYLTSGPYTNTLVQCDVYYPGAYGDMKMGVFARFSGVSEYIMATLDCSSPVSKLSVMKETPADSVVTLGTSEEYALGTGVAYTIRLQVNAAGQWAMWFWPVGGTQPSAPILSGQHDDLATGGPLDDGRVGIYDVNATGSVDINRIYDSFLADGITTSMDIQGLDFELVPIEYAAGKIATLNVNYSIGTDRPNAIFEYGSGSRSAKSYKRAISREGIVNFAYSLGEGVRVAFDIESQAARGLFEDVVSSDVVDPGLRQVLVNEHVRVRKVPREIITFEPSTTAPVYGTDYAVGDTVRARAMVNGVSRLPSDTPTLRVYGIELTIDDEGKETLVPTLVAE